MVNKKAFLRIIEATIAVLIILGVLVIISFNSRNKNGGLGPEEILNPLLEEIAKNASLREDIILNSSASETHLSLFLSEKINPYFNYSVRVCYADEICPLANYPIEVDREVYKLEYRGERV